MIEEAFEYIMGLKDAREHLINGTTYTDKKLIPVFSKKIENYINTSTLTSVVDYIKNRTDNICSDFSSFKAIVHITSPINVEVKSPIHDSSMERDKYINAAAIVPRFEFGKFYDLENFNIALQSNFIQNEDRDVILKMISDFVEETKISSSNENIVKDSKAFENSFSISNKRLPNTVTLRPYRTFIEVEQPESKFVFIMQAGTRCALFEADGGAWENTAIKNIRKFLEQELSEFIEAGKIIILA